VTALIVGWISREHFLERCQTKDFGYGPRLSLDQSALQPISRVFNLDNQQVHDYARLRNATDRRKGVVDRLVDAKKSSVDADILGMAGELAAYRWFDIPINTDQLCRSGPDHGYDLKTRYGLTIDIKATDKPRGHLFFKSAEKFKAMCAMLVVVT
jgi:hypothetical protein